MTHNYCLITTTAGSYDEAKALAEMLVGEKLAACVQITKINSVYSWEEMLHRDEEWLLQIKTRANLYKLVERALIDHHSYETPEIICVPIIEGSAPYLAWIDENTRGSEGFQ